MEKIKLWCSRSGQLHGIKTMEVNGEIAQVTTHCNKTFVVRNSRSSRSARYLRQKWFTGVCPACGVPEWKLEKFSATRFSRHQGSYLTGRED